MTLILGGASAEDVGSLMPYPRCAGCIRLVDIITEEEAIPALVSVDSTGLSYPWTAVMANGQDASGYVDRCARRVTCEQKAHKQ